MVEYKGLKVDDMVLFDNAGKKELCKIAAFDDTINDGLKGVLLFRENGWSINSVGRDFIQYCRDNGIEEHSKDFNEHSKVYWVCLDCIELAPQYNTKLAELL